MSPSTRTTESLPIEIEHGRGKIEDDYQAMVTYQPPHTPFRTDEYGFFTSYWPIFEGLSEDAVRERLGESFDGDRFIVRDKDNEIVAAHLFYDHEVSMNLGLILVHPDWRRQGLGFHLAKLSTLLVLDRNPRREDLLVIHGHRRTKAALALKSRLVRDEDLKGKVTIIETSVEDWLEEEE